MLKIIDKVKGSIPNQSDNRVRAGSKVSSIKLATEEIAFDPKRWNVLQLVGKVPPWEMVEAAAENTCNDCALRDMASETVCKECPAVFFVSRLLRGTE
jgi:hypothetical protein